MFILGVSRQAKESMIEPVIPTTFAIANNQASINIITSFLMNGCANIMRSFRMLKGANQ